MKSVYKRHSSASDLVPEELFNGIAETLNSAVSDDFAAEYPDLCETIRHNNEVFSAFKVHDECSRMVQLLLDEDGKLRSFEQWAQKAEPIASHHNKVWLRTEYDQAIRRAQQARDWKQYEEEADVLPNLRWVPSTAAHPGADHMPFWNTVRPINDPFWSEHKPGDRWGCQCSLEATDDPATPIPDGSGNDEPSPGLDGNPAVTGHLFSETHPYYPSNCSSCPFRNGDLPDAPTNKTRDCYTCEYYNACKNRVNCDVDEVYKDRLLIHHQADKSEIADNLRVARAILSSFPNVKIKINEHLIEHKHRNPEYTIDGVLADRKGVKSGKGISDGFVKAIAQGCHIVVIDFDKREKDAKRIMGLKTRDIARRINWRSRDFESGIIVACYIIYHGNAVVITKGDLDVKIKKTEDIIKKLRPQ